MSAEANNSTDASSTVTSASNSASGSFERNSDERSTAINPKKPIVRKKSKAFKLTPAFKKLTGSNKARKRAQSCTAVDSKHASARDDSIESTAYDGAASSDERTATTTSSDVALPQRSKDSSQTTVDERRTMFQQRRTQTTASDLAAKPRSRDDLDLELERTDREVVSGPASHRGTASGALKDSKMRHVRSASDDVDAKVHVGRTRTAPNLRKAPQRRVTMGSIATSDDNVQREVSSTSLRPKSTGKDDDTSSSSLDKPLDEKKRLEQIKRNCAAIAARQPNIDRDAEWSNVDENDQSAFERHRCETNGRRFAGTIEFAARNSAARVSDAFSPPPSTPVSNVSSTLLTGYLSSNERKNVDDDAVLETVEPNGEEKEKLSSESIGEPEPSRTSSSVDSPKFHDVATGGFVDEVSQLTNGVDILCAMSEASHDNLIESFDRSNARISEIERRLDEQHRDRKHTNDRILKLNQRFDADMTELKRLMSALLEVQQSTHTTTAAILYGTEKKSEASLAALQAAMTTSSISHERHVTSMKETGDAREENYKIEAKLHAVKLKTLEERLRNAKHDARQEKSRSGARETNLLNELQKYRLAADTATAHLRSVVQRGISVNLGRRRQRSNSFRDVDAGRLEYK